MKIADLFKRRPKLVEKPVEKSATLSTVSNRGNWWPLIHEWQSGSWQRNDPITVDTAMAHSAVYAASTLIASDVAKLRLKLTRRVEGTRWMEIHDGSPWLPLLRKPNNYQTRQQFIEAWMLSRLLRGNAYILKIRDNRQLVRQLKVLDPNRVQTLVADDGSIYYKLQSDNVTGIDGEGVTVPASEVIHDRMNPIFHPLVGVSPIYACGYAALMGSSIAKDSSKFFKNGAKPGGILTAPGSISDDTAKRLADYFSENFTGEKSGRIAAVGDGLKFDSLRLSAVDSQLIEQLKWTAEDIARAFHVPAFMIGAGPVPNFATVEQLTSAYYAQTLQAILESIEAVLDDGLGLPPQYGVEFDLSQLMRMDTSARWKAYSDAIGGGWMTPNEAREREDLPPVEGGESPYLQQQNFSLEALARRDAEGDPFGVGKKLPGSGEMHVGKLAEQHCINTKGYRPRLRWNGDTWVEVH